MWNTFIYDDEVYIVKIIHSSRFNIMLSNLINVWNEDLSTEDIVNRCKDLNPLISTNDETYIKTVESLTASKLTEDNIVMSKSAEELTLEFKTIIEHIQFKFNLNLKLAPELSLCKEITVPIIQTIQFLEKRQKEVCELLRKKDEEIQQHIFENGNIKRDSVITGKFDQTVFDQSASKHLCCNLFSKSEEFNKVLISKYGCAEPELLTVKKEKKKTFKTKNSLAKQILKSKRCKITNVKTQIKDE